MRKQIKSTLHIASLGSDVSPHEEPRVRCLDPQTDEPAKKSTNHRRLSESINFLFCRVELSSIADYILFVFHVVLCILCWLVHSDSLQSKSFKRNALMQFSCLHTHSPAAHLLFRVVASSCGLMSVWHSDSTYCTSPSAHDASRSTRRSRYSRCAAPSRPIATRSLKETRFDLLCQPT